jgi:hypothetical protein
VTGWVATWSEVALDQYLDLSPGRQELIDARLIDIAKAPDGEGCRYDEATDTWSTTDAQAAGFIVYTFRRSAPRLVVLRLVYL